MFSLVISYPEELLRMQTEELLQILACPRCHGELTAEGGADEPAGFVCAACALVYPVRDGIPVMLPEEAVPLDRRRADHPAA